MNIFKTYLFRYKFEYNFMWTVKIIIYTEKSLLYLNKYIFQYL